MSSRFLHPFDFGHYTPEARERRMTRHQATSQQLREGLRESLSESTVLGFDRAAYSWNMNQEKGATRKLVGHPSMAATQYVSESMSEFRLLGDYRCYYSGMHRDAGTGAHGIRDGLILVTVEVKPHHGMASLLDVPVTVKNGYMLQPSLLMYQGVPYVLSQSALDDVLAGTSIDQSVETERKHMYAPIRGESGNRNAALLKTADDPIHSSDFDKECEAIAKDLFDEYVSSNGSAPSDSSDLSDEVHEAVDGHQWIIYTRFWQEVIDAAGSCGNQDPVGDGLMEVSNADDCEKIPQLQAFMALECGVFQALSDIIDNYEEPEEEEEEEELSQDLGAPAPVQDVSHIQRAYDQGQQAPAGTQPPMTDPVEAEAFRRGNYDMHGGGFGPPPQLSRQVREVTPEGRIVFASRRSAWLRVR